MRHCGGWLRRRLASPAPAELGEEGGEQREPAAQIVEPANRPEVIGDPRASTDINRTSDKTSEKRGKGWVSRHEPASSAFYPSSRPAALQAPTNG